MCATYETPPQERNLALKSGGAIFTAGAVRLDVRPGARFRGNSAQQLFGGAICVIGNAPQQTTVRGVSFEACTAGAGGGAVAALGATVVVDNSTFDGNAGIDGGAVFSAAAWVNVSGSLLVQNSAAGGSGARGGAGPSSDPLASPSAAVFSAPVYSAAATIFTTQRASSAASSGPGGRGGAAYVTTLAAYFGSDGPPASLSAASVNLTDNDAVAPRALFTGCRFERNAGASFGGAVAALGQVAVVLSSTELLSNSAGSLPAHVLAALGSGQPNVGLATLSSWSSDNAGYAAGSGGALWVGPRAAASVAGCQLVSNAAARDGGAACVAGAGASLLAERSTFDLNSAPSGAGGAFLLSGDASLTVSASDLRRHSAAMGAAAAFAALPRFAPAASAGPPAWNAQLRSLNLSGSVAAAGGVFAAIDSPASPAAVAAIPPCVECALADNRALVYGRLLASPPWEVRVSVDGGARPGAAARIVVSARPGPAAFVPPKPPPERAPCDLKRTSGVHATLKPLRCLVCSLHTPPPQRWWTPPSRSSQTSRGESSSASTAAEGAPPRRTAAPRATSLGSRALCTGARGAIDLTFKLPCASVFFCPGL